MIRSLAFGDSGRAGKSARDTGSGQPRAAFCASVEHRSAVPPAEFLPGRRRSVSGLTLIELLVAVALLVAISAVAIPTYQGYMDDVRVNNVRKDFALIEIQLERYRTDNGGSLPDALNETAVTTLVDPWGNPYQFLNIEDATGPGLGKVRKDKNLVPLNTDFDLYSMGKDGQSKSPLTATVSHDDIVRANNGAYVGLASEY